MEFLIIALLILFNGLFSMSEIAVISSRKSKLKNEAKRGSKKANKALGLAENPDNFLSTVQVGITLIGIITGMYSGDILAAKVAPWVVEMGVPATYAYPATRIVLVILITYLTIVFGELVPKRLGMTSPETISKFIAPIMSVLSKIVYPFVWILSQSTSLIFRLFGVKDNGNVVTEEEIKTMIREGAEGGDVQAVEQDIVERVFSLGDRDLESIMTPRREIVWLDKNATQDEIKEIIAANTFGKYPVVDGNPNHVEGVVYLKDIFNHINEEGFRLLDIVRPAHYYYEGKEVYQTLEQMKENHDYYAIITDEFGAMSGIVTMKDILEAIMGDLPEHNEDPEIVRRKDDSYLVDGQCPFYNFLQYFKEGDLYATNDYNTLGGLILEELGHIPSPGETLEWKDFQLEILDMDGPRIDKVLVKLKTKS